LGRHARAVRRGVLITDLGLPGDAVRKGAPGYDEARERLTWNARLRKARAPDAIIRPGSTAEVAALVRHAAARGLSIGLRSGGHSYEASALRDGGILLDLGGLDGIAIDDAAKTAWIGPGLQGGALIEALAAHGLAFPIGHCADVGLGGYLLSGGFGWNMGEWGPACASVLEVELVLASGEVVHASADEHPDLFWAARGAGAGFFAVATGFRLALHALPAAAFALTATFAAESAEALATWLTKASRRAARSAEITCLVGPHFETGQPAIVLRAEAADDSRSEARRRIAPLLDLPPVARIGDSSERALDFAELTKLSAIPPNKRVAADHIWSEAPIGDLLLAVAPLAGIPGKMSTVNLFGLGGVGEVRHAPDERQWALSVGGGSAAGIYGVWDDAADDARHLDWVRQVDAALAPLRTGRYVGEAKLKLPGRMAECFTPAALDRIERLRAEYDPQGLF
jgi:FAD/FMN-containing dehydrogenase